MDCIAYLKYINPVLTFLISSAFAIVLYAIKMGNQINKSDEKGLSWFMRAFWIWAVVNLLKIFPIAISIDPMTANSVRSKLFTGLIISLSTANSYCILKSLSFIEITNENKSLRLVREYTRPKALLGWTITFIALTFMFVFALTGDGNKKLIWLPDIAYSIITTILLGIVIYRALSERGVTHIKWLILCMFIFLFSTQILQLIQPKGLQWTPVYTFINSIVSITYKVIFCLVILVLLYSWRLKSLGDTSLKWEAAVLDCELLRKENEGQKNLIEQQSKKMISDKIELESFEKERLFHLTLIDPHYPCIQFFIDNKEEKYFVRLKDSNSDFWVDVNFKGHLEPFRRLFKLSIHKKYGGQEKEFMIYNEGIQRQDLNDEDHRREYYRPFRTKDRTEILEIVTGHFPEFENVFFDRVTRLIEEKHQNVILLKTVPGNIFMPPVSGTEPDQVFESYRGMYQILQRIRDDR